MDASLSPLDLVAESQVLERTGDIGAALECGRRALVIARASGDALTLAEALNCVCFTLFRVGAFDEAFSLAQEALTLAPPESSARAHALLLFGLCSSVRDDSKTAEEYYLLAVELSRRLGDHWALVRALHNLSTSIYRDRGQFAMALATDEEALHLATERGLPRYGILGNLAFIYWMTGQRTQARTMLDKLHQECAPGSPAAGYEYLLRGNLALDEEHLDEAREFFSRAQIVAEVVGDPPLNILLRFGLSRWSLAKGEVPAARDWAEDALALAKRAHSSFFIGSALVTRGRAAWMAGRLSDAENDLREADNILAKVQANFELARARLLLAALRYRSGMDAAAAWQRAAEVIITGGYGFLLEQERAIAFPLLAAHLNHPDPEIARVSSVLLGDLKRVPPPPLTVLTLGRFEVRQGSRLIPDDVWRQRRAGELFRLLIISPNHTLPREEIIETFWPDKEPTLAQALLHKATSTLRHVLEPELPDKFPSRYVQIEEGYVTLYLPPGTWLDYEAFERHVQAGEWEAALSLYQGDLFPGDRYAEWAVLPRERLIRLYLRAAEAVVRTYMNDSRFQEALDICHRMLAMDSWQENVVLLGMQACLALGDRAGALRLYKNLERTLREELHTTPQATLQRFYQSLL